MAPSVPRCAGVNSISAPRAARILTRSSLTASDMVNKMSYPLTAATMARPIPVLPLVASKMVLPLINAPDFSASSIIFKAGRSLMDPPGLSPSSLASISTSMPDVSRAMETRGVLPILSRILL